MNQHNYNQDPGLHDFGKMDPEAKILFRASAFRLPEGKSTETALADLKKRISENHSARPAAKEATTRRLWLVSSVAAAIIILFGLWQLLSLAGETRIYAGKGAHVSYTLSDGSAVQLNSDSKISFSKRSFESDRKLELDGEAFFEVTKGSSFRVSTPNGMVNVLGTSFNVFSRDNTFRVACLAGKVMVASGKQSVTIDPGESAVLEGGMLKKYRDDKMKYTTGWINGEFYFENAPLNMVFSEIERQFNVKFVGKERGDEFFTGSFVNKDLKTALEIVCIPMGLEYEIKDDGKISVSDKRQ